MRLPTKEECFELLKEYKVPQNIIDHSITVTKIAVFLAKKLKQKGIDVNVDLVEKASLLHDIDKIPSLKDLTNHGEIGREILVKKGLNDIADVTAVHIAESLEDGKVDTWEKKLVNYADKRVKHNSIVTIDERYDDLIQRYHHVSEQGFNKMRKLIKDVEKQIFQNLDFKPEELEKEMGK